MNRLIGLHIRFQQSPFEIFEKAKRLKLAHAQFFLHNQTGTILHLSQQEYASFRKESEKQFKQLVAHGSYIINLASPERSYHPAFNRELSCAQHLGCTHFVLHPGSAPSVEQGIDALARQLNKVCKTSLDLQLVLENTAFAAPTIGNDLHHFGKLLEKLDQPERLLFCIDTAHAFSAGYDLVHNQQAFIELLSTTIGFERLALIHVNDTAGSCGCNKDVHLMIGSGLLGTENLKKFILHKQLASLPLILELPLVSEDQEEQALALVRSWHNNETIT